MNRVHPVVGLTIVDRALDRHATRVLVVVRDATTNVTHPDVISVPTIRVPKSLFESLFERSDVEGTCGSTDLYDRREVSSEETNGHDAAIFVTKTLLASKLGVSEALESGLVSFRTRLRASATSRVCQSNVTSSEFETISMANLLVTVSRGADVFPLRTASYSQIIWAPIDQFLNAVQQKDPSLLGLSPLEFCIHGLCIATAYDMMAYEFGLDAFSTLCQTMLDRGL